MKELFILWLVAAMNTVAPAHRPQFVKEAQESHEQADARYREIAEAILSVAFDSEEEPIFEGAFGRSKTAVFIMHKFYMESGFRKDVQYGLGRERLDSQGWNDFGRSWCLGQVMLGRKVVRTENGKWTTDSAQTTREGWTGRDLVGDTEKCVRATLHIAQRSIAACRSLPAEEQLAAYISGTCESERGKAESRRRYRSFNHTWYKAWKNYPVPDGQQAKQEPTKL